MKSFVLFGASNQMIESQIVFLCSTNKPDKPVSYFIGNYDVNDEISYENVLQILDVSYEIGCVVLSYAYVSNEKNASNAQIAQNVSIDASFPTH